MPNLQLLDIRQHDNEYWVEIAPHDWHIFRPTWSAGSGWYYQHWCDRYCNEVWQHFTQPFEYRIGDAQVQAAFNKAIHELPMVDVTINDFIGLPFIVKE